MDLWDHEGLRYDSANWSTQRKNETSNWKEGTNITFRVEELAEEHKLDNVELFILTDDQVFEGFFYKWHYNPQKLNGLVLGMRLVEIGTVCILKFIHVARTRMKRAGIDGLSRGYLLEGIMTGQNPLDLIPMNESADDRSGGRVVSWIDSWWKDRT